MNKSFPVALQVQQQAEAVNPNIVIQNVSVPQATAVETITPAVDTTAATTHTTHIEATGLTPDMLASIAGQQVVITEIDGESVAVTNVPEDSVVGAPEVEDEEEEMVVSDDVAEESLQLEDFAVVQETQVSTEYLSSSHKVFMC